MAALFGAAIFVLLREIRDDYRMLGLILFHSLIAGSTPMGDYFVAESAEVFVALFEGSLFLGSTFYLFQVASIG